MKLTLIERREFEVEEYKGFSYAGFSSDGKVISFTSEKKHEIYEGQTGYNPEKSTEIEMKTKVWDGKVKFQEKGSFEGGN